MHAMRSSSVLAPFSIDPQALVRGVFGVLFPLSLLAQNEQDRWHFGSGAALDFTSGTPTTILTSALYHSEGCSSIADASGNLLFYSDGRKVWNANNAQMPNGVGLLANYSSTQGVLIVPHPGNSDQYFVFTVGDFAGSFGSCGCFTYSIVDMTLQGGLGDVLNPKNVIVHSNTTEKLSAIEDDCGNLWVMIHEWQSNAFLAYRVTTTGVNPAPVTSAVGTTYASSQDYIGEMEFSPAGDRIATVLHGTRKLVLYDFDINTGIVSNERLSPIVSTGSSTIYGLEFSPDGGKLYVSSVWNSSGGTDGNIYQFDLAAGSTAAIWVSKMAITPVGRENLGALKLGPDGKIYATEYDNTYLHAIEDPNALGLACNFNANAASLGTRQGRYGLPNMVLTSGTPCTVLPIELLSFTGYAADHSSVLSWTTASEQNNDHFTLQRSADALTFHAIAVVQGAGSSQQSIDYTHVDHAPLDGVNYYRLQQTDFDGSSTLSSIVAVEHRSGQVVIAFPNPAHDRLQLAPGFYGEGVSVEIRNALGQLLLRTTAEAALDIAALPTGAYAITVWRQETPLATARFVKE
jgi:WD40 repeat protein